MFGIPYSGIHWLYHMPITFRGLIFRVLIARKFMGYVLIFVVHKFSWISGYHNPRKFIYHENFHVYGTLLNCLEIIFLQLLIYLSLLGHLSSQTFLPMFYPANVFCYKNISKSLRK